MAIPGKKTTGNYVIRYEMKDGTVRYGDSTLTLAAAQGITGMLNRHNRSVQHSYVTLKEAEKAAAKASKLAAKEEEVVETPEAVEPEKVVEPEKAAAKVKAVSKEKLESLPEAVQTALHEGGVDDDEQLAAIFPALLKEEKKILGIGPASIQKIKAALK